MNTALSALRINFLYVDRYSFGRTWTYPASHIPYCMLRFIIAGTAEFMINGEAFTVRAGEIIYVPEGCTLACHALEEIFHSSASASMYPSVLPAKIFSAIILVSNE